KGIDLLLYASRLLKERGVKHQLAIAGSAAFGKGYEDVCRSIARHLRLEVSWTRQVSDELRSALYRASRCVVYPSIHREPFGMVATEAMAHGTPVIVPDHGGVGETIRIGGRAGGLAFRAWDSRDLADQLERLLTDDALHAALAAAGPGLAARFSIDAMTDRLLAHMGLPMRA
ncbi:MAG TPA: glycosyltransferase, partial [Dongiaceae bacterium]|nr:glycosyltransferase [Dongiaceae bacterium]